jgi:hypothetical protein
MTALPIPSEMQDAYVDSDYPVDCNPNMRLAIELQNFVDEVIERSVRLSYQNGGIEQRTTTRIGEAKPGDVIFNLIPRNLLQ